MLFELTGPHYIDDRYLEAGAIIGTGRTTRDGKKISAPYPGSPTSEMEPLDPEAEREMDRFRASHPEAFIQPLDYLSRHGDDPTDPTVRMRKEIEMMKDAFLEVGRAMAQPKSAPITIPPSGAR